MVTCVKGGPFSKIRYERIGKWSTEGVKAMFIGSTKQNLVGSQILHIKRVQIRLKENIVISGELLD